MLCSASPGIPSSRRGAESCNWRRQIANSLPEKEVVAAEMNNERRSRDLEVDARLFLTTSILFTVSVRLEAAFPFSSRARPARAHGLG